MRKSFARDVYAEAIPASPKEREKLRRDIEQYQFMYNLQKAVVIGIGPSISLHPNQAAASKRSPISAARPGHCESVRPSARCRQVVDGLHEGRHYRSERPSRISTRNPSCEARRSVKRPRRMDGPRRQVDPKVESENLFRNAARSSAIDGRTAVARRAVERRRRFRDGIT